MAIKERKKNMEKIITKKFFVLIQKFSKENHSNFMNRKVMIQFRKKDEVTYKEFWRNSQKSRGTV